MKLHKAIMTGTLAAFFLALAVHCSRTAFAAPVIDQKAWCAAQWHKCNTAAVHYKIHNLEKEVLEEYGAAIWWFEGTKYK